MNARSVGAEAAMPPLGATLAASVETEGLLAERLTRLDAGDRPAAAELLEAAPARLAIAVAGLEALEAWAAPPDLAIVQREAVNVLAFQSLRWRMVAESLDLALAGEIERALERRGASYGALADQQRSWQLLGFTLQCVQAQRPAAVAALALSDDVRAALGLPAAPASGETPRPDGMAAARLTIASVPPRRQPGSDEPAEAPRTLTTPGGVAAESLLRELDRLQPEPAWLERARQDYLAIVREAMRRLIDGGDDRPSLLTRLATTVAERPVDFGAAKATGYGMAGGLLWGTVELDVSLPRAGNGWWTLTDDERMAMLGRLRAALGWAAVAADAVVPPDTLTALDLPDALRLGAGLTWQQRLSPTAPEDRDATLARLDREMAAITRDRDDALEEWTLQTRALVGRAGASAADDGA
jgi:hypothetical protein